MAKKKVVPLDLLSDLYTELITLNKGRDYTNAKNEKRIVALNKEIREIEHSLAVNKTVN